MARLNGRRRIGRRMMEAVAIVHERPGIGQRALSRTISPVTGGQIGTRTVMAIQEQGLVRSVRTNGRVHLFPNETGSAS